MSKFFNDDNLEDKECSNKSLGNIRTLAAQYGIVGSICTNVSGEKRNVRVLYLKGHQAARHVVQKFDEMMLGENYFICIGCIPHG